MEAPQNKSLAGKDWQAKERHNYVKNGFLDENIQLKIVIVWRNFIIQSLFYLS